MSKHILYRVKGVLSADKSFTLPVQPLFIKANLEDGEEEPTKGEAKVIHLYVEAHTILPGSLPPTPT